MSSSWQIKAFPRNNLEQMSKINNQRRCKINPYYFTIDYIFFLQDLDMKKTEYRTKDLPLHTS